MIKEVKVFSRFHMKSFATYGTIPLKFKKWYLISINDGNKLLNEERTTAFKYMGCLGSISLNFADITKEVYDRVKKKHPDAVLFNNEHAKKIVSFIKRAHNSKHEVTLVAHCHAGISRSGATGTFACDYCGLDYNKFIRSNPNIFANQYILQLLWEASDLKVDKPNDGRTEIDKGEIIQIKF